MAKILIAYFSRGGNTKKMAEIIMEAAKNEGVDVVLKDIVGLKAKELLDYDGIIIGSPTYYGAMSSSIKELFDESVAFHGKLNGKVGGAFSSAGNIGGGNETTILSILNAMLIHGMIIQGDSRGDHYGPVSIGSPDSRASAECKRFGARLAQLVKKCTS